MELSLEVFPELPIQGLGDYQKIKKKKNCMKSNCTINSQKYSG
jgi:hypothetical protein